MSTSLSLFSKRCDEIEVYFSVIRKFKLDDTIRDKWFFPELPATNKSVEKWKSKYPQYHIGLKNDVQRLLLIFELPPDRFDTLESFICKRVIPVHGNRIITKQTTNETTGETELWVQIHKSTTIGDLRTNWVKKIKPLQAKLIGDIHRFDNIALDEYVYDLKVAKVASDELEKRLLSKFNVGLDYKTINNAYARYNKLAKLARKLASTL